MRERERKREKNWLVSSTKRTLDCVREGVCVCVCECLCVCVYVVGPRRKWTQGMVKRLTHKSYTNKSVSRILCFSLCVRMCVCVMPQLFDPKCSDKAYVPAIYITYKQTCPHIYTHGIRSVCVMNMCTSHRLNTLWAFAKNNSNWKLKIIDVIRFGYRYASILRIIVYRILWNHSENVAQERTVAVQVQWLTDWLIGVWIGWLIDCLMDCWLVDWLIEPQQKS